jgi:hypothetical protein
VPENRPLLLSHSSLPFHNPEVFLNHTAEEWNSEKTGTVKRNKSQEGLTKKVELVPANQIKDEECVN